MNKYQLITEFGMTIGIFNAITAKEAIRKARANVNQSGNKFDRYWTVKSIKGNKVNFGKNTDVNSDNFDILNNVL